MADNKIQKQQAAVLKAQERLGVSLLKERDGKRKRRDGRLLKLGVLAEQMFLAGDLPLLSRFEQAALEQFKDRKVDRLDFELDDALNWFDKTREEAMVAKAHKGEPPKAATATVAAASAGASGTSASGAKHASSPAPRSTAAGASSSNGTSVATSPSGAASA